MLIRHLLICGLLLCVADRAAAHEALWIEAEHMAGIQGFCWPMGDDSRKMRETKGNWGLSGPGWAAEWNQGGESGFLSIATGPGDDKAVVTKAIEIPADGAYFVWVRYGDWREQTERFQVRIEQPGQAAWTGRYGEQAIIEEDNVMKLYWGWSFVWAANEAPLKKGPATISLVSSTKEPTARQIDVLVLTTDAAYRPRIKDRPANPTWQLLNSYRNGIPGDLRPLARRTGNFELPAAWKLRTFADKGFRYLWNVADQHALETWLSDDPAKVRVPYSIRDDDTLQEFNTKYGGAKDVPIFSDPRITPTFHAVGAGMFATDPASGDVKPLGQAFARWLDAHPDQMFGTMMNYHGGVPVGDKGVALFQKYRDRYVGSIAGESLGYIDGANAKMPAATAAATTRRQLAAAMSPVFLAENTEKYRKIYGKEIDKNPYQDVISCLSVGNICAMPLALDWGARTIGYESAAATSVILNMRWAFMRGAARQGDRLTATYRSCNFGDSATMFSVTSSYTSPRNLFDNYYSVYSGAGMTWYKFDIWYQYMAGSSMFYHEQGFDEWWKPGGLTAAGVKEVQLSPKGKLVDRFLRTTARDFDRGVPFTPVAFLVDYAHGWEPSPYWPNSFKNWHGNQDRFLYGDHEKMLEEYFWTAYYPIGPESEKPMTGTNETFLAGVFGDVFDVVFAYPDVSKWTTLDTYPVVIANGEIELTAAEGQRLAAYVEKGGTLVVADTHLTGPGVPALKLPAGADYAEAAGYRWLDDNQVHPAPRYRYRTVAPNDEKMTVLASTPEGAPVCVAIDRGQGRIVYLAVPYGMSIGKQASPIVARLLAHLTRGLMPVEVDGDVQWMVNRTRDSWVVTLLNPAGQHKPQQGLTPTDFRENRTVTLRSHVPITSARDRLLETDKFTVEGNAVKLEVSAGGVRIIELK